MFEGEVVTIDQNGNTFCVAGIENVLEFVGETKEQKKLRELVLELKPCKCGSLELTLSPPTKSKKLKWVEYSVHCKLCSTNIYGYYSPEEAVNAWNYRPVEEKLMLQLNEADRVINELRSALNSVVAKNIELREGINELLECPMWVDQATVPKAGVEANPKQVVIEASISLLKIRKLKDLVGIEE